MDRSILMLRLEQLARDEEIEDDARRLLKRTRILLARSPGLGQDQVDLLFGLHFVDHHMAPQEPSTPNRSRDYYYRTAGNGT